MQVTRHRHAQLRVAKVQLGQPAGADRGVLVAAVEGREGRERLQRVGDGGPPLRPKVVIPATSSINLSPFALQSMPICSTAGPAPVLGARSETWVSTRVARTFPWGVSNVRCKRGPFRVVAWSNSRLGAENGCAHSVMPTMMFAGMIG